MVDPAPPSTTTSDAEWLINSVAHALRNTLFAALLKAEMLLRSTDTPEARALYQSLKRMEGFIEEMLLFGRPAHLEPRTVELGPFLDHLAARYTKGERLEPAEVEVHMEEPGLVVEWDPEAVRVSLERILDNAVQHTPPPHRIRLSAAPSGGDGVAITVADRGPGIDPALVEHVFEPFFPQHEGRAGLGLSTARKLVRASGGEVHLESTPGRGTTVTVTLPRRTPS